MKTYKQVSEDKTYCDMCGVDITCVITDRHAVDHRYIGISEELPYGRGKKIVMTVSYETEYGNRHTEMQESNICPKCLGETARWYGSTFEEAA